MTRWLRPRNVGCNAGLVPVVLSFDADGLTRALYSEPPELQCDRLSADSLALSSELPEIEKWGETHFRSIASKMADLLYASQNEATCGARVEDACGLVSLYNALVHRSVPVDFVRLAELFDQSHAAGTGLSPGELRDFTVRALAAFAPHLRATLHEGGAQPTVRAGSLIFVDSVRLKNAVDRERGGAGDFLEVPSSHIVFVESVGEADGSVTLINPDLCCFGRRMYKHDHWGRLTIPYDVCLDRVWRRTVRLNGTETAFAAVHIL